MRRLKMLLASWLGIVGLTLIFLLPRASADSIAYFLNIPNSALSPVTGPYGMVSVNRTDSTHATIMFTSFSGFLFQDGASAAVNVHATSVTVNNLTGNNLGSPHSAPSLTSIFNTTGSQVDGFGNYNLVINDSDSFTNATNIIIFGLTNSSGSWVSASDVLTNIMSAAAHIGVCNVGCTAFSLPIEGFARTNDAVVSPEPATVLLVGTLLSGLGFFGRKKFIETLRN